MFGKRKIQLKLSKYFGFRPGGGVCRWKALSVKEIRILCNTTYPICPGCRCSVEREYQSFCDRCGQKLDWGMYCRCFCDE